MTTPKKRQRKKMPPLAKVKEDYAAGMTPTQMAKAYAIGKSTVTSFLTKHGISQKRRVVYPPDDEIIAALQAREPIYVMADRFGISRDSMWRRIHERRLRDFVEPPPPKPIVLTGLQPSSTKVIVTAPDGSRISVPRIPTIHGKYEARP